MSGTEDVNDVDELARLRKENSELKEKIAKANIVEPSNDGWDYLRIPPHTVLVLDLLDGELEVEEDKLMEAMRYADDQEQVFMAYKYSELLDGESLQQHLMRINASTMCPGPYDEEAMIYASKRFMDISQLPNIEVTRKMLAMWWRGGYWKFWREADREHTHHTALHQSQEWNSFLKNCMLGNYQPYGLIALNNGAAGKHQAQACKIVNAPIVIRSKEGKRHWGQVRQASACLRIDYHDTFMRYIHFVKNTPVCMTVVLAETGAILHQNHASMATFGNHGPLNLVHLKDGNEKRRQLSTLPLTVEQADEEGLSFLELLFLGSEDLERMKATKINGLFSTRIEIKSNRLRSWIQLGPNEEAYHDLRSVVIQDPTTFAPIYILTHIDVTDTVLAQKAVLKANHDLAEEKIRMDALLKRQYDLIDMLKSLPGDSSAHVADARESVRDKVSFLHDALAQAGAVSPAEADDIKLLNVLGRGTFGTVYLGEWRGAAVAVKRIVLPAAMSNSERAQKMAIMEIAISSSMFHPNLVQTYTYSIKQLRDQEDDEGLKFSGGGGTGGHVNAHEMRLVLEYCDKGSLSFHLMQYGGVRSTSGSLQYANVIETAADVARAMLHLHRNNVCHNDLKAANILLKSEGTDGRGVRAKVMDFGLSIKLDSQATHVSNLFQGTVTHMAPEVLMEGKQSKAADVYAYGMTLWEICSGGSAYKGIPHMALGQLIVFKHKRPRFPKDTPIAIKDLAERCWQPKATSRPSFETILEELQKLKASIDEQSEPWPAVPPSLQPAASGGFSEPFSSIGEDRESPIEPLDTAQFASRGSAEDIFENWVPTIVGDESAVPAKGSRAAAEEGSRAGSAKLSEQAMHDHPGQRRDLSPISDHMGHDPLDDSISLKNPSSGQPSAHSERVRHSSTTDLSKDNGTLGKQESIGESIGAAKDSREGQKAGLTAPPLLFRTVQSINEELLKSHPDSNKPRDESRAGEASPSPIALDQKRLNLHELTASPTLSPLPPPNPQPQSPIKLNLGDLNRAQEMAHGKSNSDRQSGQPIKAMTIKMSVGRPSLERFLTASTSATPIPTMGSIGSPTGAKVPPIQEDPSTDIPAEFLARLKKTGGQLATVATSTSMGCESFQGDSLPYNKPSVSFQEPGSSRANRVAGFGGRSWLAFFSPSFTGVSRAASNASAGSENTSSKSLGKTSSFIMNGDSGSQQGSFRKDKSVGRTRSFKGSISRLLGLGGRRKGPEHNSFGSASTNHSKDPPQPGQIRRVSD